MIRFTKLLVLLIHRVTADLNFVCTSHEFLAQCSAPLPEATQAEDQTSRGVAQLTTSKGNGLQDSDVPVVLPPGESQWKMAARYIRKIANLNHGFISLDLGKRTPALL